MFCLLRRNDTSSQNNEEYYLLLRWYVTPSWPTVLPEYCIVLLPAAQREYNECSHHDITETAIIVVVYMVSLGLQTWEEYIPRCRMCANLYLNNLRDSDDGGGCGQ
jgi:hypothetical protein